MNNDGPEKRTHAQPYYRAIIRLEGLGSFTSSIKQTEMGFDPLAIQFTDEHLELQFCARPVKVVDQEEDFDLVRRGGWCRHRGRRIPLLVCETAPLPSRGSQRNVDGISAPGRSIRLSFRGGLFAEAVFTRLTTCALDGTPTAATGRHQFLVDVLHRSHPRFKGNVMLDPSAGSCHVRGGRTAILKRSVHCTGDALRVTRRDHQSMDLRRGPVPLFLPRP